MNSPNKVITVYFRQLNDCPIKKQVISRVPIAKQIAKKLEMLTFI